MTILLLFPTSVFLLLSACSLKVGVPRGFSLFSLFQHTAFLTICSFQVASFELMIWALTYVLRTTKASSTALPSALSCRLDQPNTPLHILPWVSTVASYSIQTNLKVTSSPPQYFFSRFIPPWLPLTFFIVMYFIDNAPAIKSWNHFLPIAPVEWTVDHLFSWIIVVRPGNRKMQTCGVQLNLRNG